MLPSGLGHEALWSDWQQSQPTLGRFAHPVLRTSRIVSYGAVPEDARAASRDAVPFKLRRYGTDPSHWAVHAAGQAIADAAIAWDDLPEDRRGLFSGQGDYSHPDIGSLRASVQAARQPGGKLDYRVLARQALYRRGADPFMGVEALGVAFVVVVVGGIGSFGGALVGGLLIGVVQSVMSTLWPQGAQLMIYIAMVAVLLLRPHGLLGRG